MQTPPRPGLATTVAHSLRCTCDRCITDRAAEVASRGVILRFETSDDMGTACTTLCIASCEPPSDPESRIVAQGGRLLAEANPDSAEWMFTALGLKLIEIEATGRVERAS